jgi:hypothetical protein
MMMCFVAGGIAHALHSMELQADGKKVFRT